MAQLYSTQVVNDSGNNDESAGGARQTRSNRQKGSTFHIVASATDSVNTVKLKVCEKCPMEASPTSMVCHLQSLRFFCVSDVNIFLPVVLVLPSGDDVYW